MLKIFYKDGVVETFGKGVAFTESLKYDTTFIWSNIPSHPEMTKHDDIIDQIVTSSIEKIEIRK